MPQQLDFVDTIRQVRIAKQRFARLPQPEVDSHLNVREIGQPISFRIFPSQVQSRTVLYDFEVLKDGSVILRQTIHLPHISDAWPAINQLARRFRERGHRIRVKDQAGGIVVLTGVTAVLASRDGGVTT